MKNKILDNNRIKNLLGHEGYKIEPIMINASGRCYARASSVDGSFVICKYKNLKKEENTRYLSGVFKKSKISSVVIYKQDLRSKITIQKDLGKQNLAEYMKDKTAKECDSLIKKSIRLCVKMMSSVHKNIDYSRLGSGPFDSNRLKVDTINFKKYFLRKFGFKVTKGIDRNIKLLLLEYSKIPKDLYFFTHRDFNLRNLVINGREISVVDIQDGNLGPVTYDLASLLVSSSFNISMGGMQKYINFYKNEFYKKLGIRLDNNFEKYLYITMCLRIMQAMGAYGRMHQSKIYHKKTIYKKFVFYLKKMEEVLKILSVSYHLDLGYLIETCHKSFLFFPEISELPIYIESFSYKKIPILNSDSLNLLLDLRVFENPGRNKKLKGFTGKDRSVLAFLDKNRDLKKMIKSQYFILKNIQKQKYKYSEQLKSIRILIGCTGGRHRSVYAAEALKKLFEKDKKIFITHNNI